MKEMNKFVFFCVLSFFAFTSFVYADELIQQNENECGRQYYLDSNGECQLCESGYYCPDGIHMIECPDGFFSMYGDYECHPCGCVDEESCRKSDTYKVAGIMKYDNIEIFAGSCEGHGPCKPGFEYDETTGWCWECPERFHCPGNYSRAIGCPNHFVPNHKGTKCIECDIGYGSFGGECHPCPKQTYYSKKTKRCEYCGKYEYQDEEGQLKCKKCPRGHVQSLYPERKCVTREQAENELGLVSISRFR